MHHVTSVKEHLFFLFFSFAYAGYQLLRAPPVGMDFCVHDRFLSRHKGSHTPSSGRRMLGVFSVAGTDISSGHQRQDLLSPSLIFDACVLRLDLGLYSHPKE